MLLWNPDSERTCFTTSSYKGVSDCEVVCFDVLLFDVNVVSLLVYIPAIKGSVLIISHPYFPSTIIVKSAAMFMKMALLPKEISFGGGQLESPQLVRFKSLNVK